jgi:hypothetical protein
MEQPPADARQAEQQDGDADRLVKLVGVYGPPIRYDKVTCSTMAAAISQCRTMARVG